MLQLCHFVFVLTSQLDPTSAYFEFVIKNIKPFKKKRFCNIRWKLYLYLVLVFLWNDNFLINIFEAMAHNCWVITFARSAAFGRSQVGPSPSSDRLILPKLASSIPEVMISSDAYFACKSLTQKYWISSLFFVVELVHNSQQLPLSLLSGKLNNFYFIC